MLGERIPSVFRTAARGLEAQRVALGTHTENIANANTTRTEEEEPYAIKQAVHEVEGENHTRFNEILNRSSLDLQRTAGDAPHIDGPSLRREIDESELGPVTDVEEIQEERLEYDPSHPDADGDGYVRYPDVNVVEEMSGMMSANRIYEANLTMVEAAQEMAQQTLQV